MQSLHQLRKMWVKSENMTKKFFRCNVCNDIHYGISGPEMCPTCQTKNAYVEITKEEAKNVMEL